MDMIPKVSLTQLLTPRSIVVLRAKRKSLSVYVPYVKGALEKFERIGEHCNIRTIVRTEHILRSSRMKTRPEGDPQQTAQCV
jgi:hypothetical protein